MDEERGGDEMTQATNFRGKFSMARWSSESLAEIDKGTEAIAKIMHKVLSRDILTDIDAPFAGLPAAWNKAGDDGTPPCDGYGGSPITDPAVMSISFTEFGEEDNCPRWHISFDEVIREVVDGLRCSPSGKVSEGDEIFCSALRDKLRDLADYVDGAICNPWDEV